MVGLQRTVLADVAGWLAEGQRVWLCTIIETWGSSPRPAGSWLALNERGHWSGSVSGGCLEEDLIRRCTGEQPETRRCLEYGVTDADRETFLLPCGGRIRLLVEPLATARSLAHVEALLSALDNREMVTRRLHLETDEATVMAGTEAGQGTVVSVEDGVLRHCLSPGCHLLLVGAGEVAHYVAEFAEAADFRVSLCEPRDAFSQGWRLGSVPLLRSLPDDLVAAQFSDPWSGVLALAHDPRVDDMALLAALRSRCFYVGAMGSVRTSAARRQRLASLGMSDAELSRLRAPIGLDIPSKTPVEIAIAIVADLIRARHDLLASRTPL